MSARDAMKAMMDSLMGASRDMTHEEKEKNRKDFDDPSLDKYALVGCSPYVLLSETKNERMLPSEGWGKLADTGLARDFAALPQEKKDAFGFEYDLMKLLRSLVDTLDRQIENEKTKIANEEQLPPDVLVQIGELELKIKALQDAAEAAGEEGDVDQAQESIASAQQIEAQAQALRAANKPRARRDYVCPISGAVYSSGDEETKRRLMEGKLYNGWVAIREKLAELEARVPPPPPAKGGTSREPPRRERSPRRDDRYDDRRRDYRRDDRRDSRRDERRDSRRYDDRRDSRRDRDRDDRRRY